MEAGRLVAGRYRLGEPLGRGGMGQVFRAVDERLRREVAVKVVDLAATGDPTLEERFHREAVATARLNHPNIVTIFDADSDGRTAYLVMELLTGRPLSRIIRDAGALDVDQAIRVAREVARALVATHAIGVVHRDIKPGNIMIQHGSVKLLDFGIALVTLDAESHLTASATTIGTAAYMSPEQAMGRRATSASDVYALGGVMLAMLTGRPPYTGDNAVQVAYRHVTDPAPRVTDLRPDAVVLDPLVGRMLDKDPTRRPSAADVVAELDRLAAAPAARTRVLPVPPRATQVLPAFGQSTRVLPQPAPRPATVSAPPRSPVAPAPARVPRSRGGDGGLAAFRRAASWIALLITGLLVLIVLWAGGTAVVRALPGQLTPPALPSLPSLPALPGIQAPELPSARELALQAATSAVSGALATIDVGRSDEASHAKDRLSSQWADAADAIVAGEDAAGALNRFGQRVTREERAGALSPIEAGTIRLALRAVRAAL